MKQTFNKYQGAGNDFVIVDNRNNSIDPENQKLINRLCDRRFGIGGDGLILVSDHPRYDYEMKYFNSDGKLGTMCGNGGRCVAHFAHKQGISGNRQMFIASDGEHEAVVEGGIVSLKMVDVTDYRLVDNNWFIDTGSPHYIVFQEDVDNFDVYTEGKKLRWSDLFAPGGTNVNFVQVTGKGLNMRTFERGVEDETLACGTGATASAIASVLSRHFDSKSVDIRVKGGNLNVRFTRENNRFSDVWLTGPATFVFNGKVEV